ncbi:HAD family hydrolase [Allopontixanthobacter sediminis]|uniref:HAD hydrolase-like protein n=1 Tax=Allopontixanthobacter sediminis TaxID=1689985 RepID=A0A845B2B2_9SPHN|nr:HAD family hydrolase [Allopontixanthobacter sediminis]MXP44326.1 HAD hydrolase-like protein [Allopontixanthobacter sediminis]
MIDRPILVFDLDDTLYLERDFVRSGFRAVGTHVAQTEGIAGFGEACWELFDSGTRSKVFDAALARAGLPQDEDGIARLVDIYRNHSPEIALANDAAAFLSGGDRSTRAIITDGPEKTQKAKIASLRIGGDFGLILTTGSWPAGYGKPHIRAFSQIMNWSGAPPEQHVYIADNPAKDFLAPRQLGWRSIQVNRPGRIHDPVPPAAPYAAEAEVASFDELPRIIGGFT